MTPGDVALIPAKYLPSIEHDKFIVCICPTSNFYFYINTDPRYAAPEETQILVIGKLELPFLDHTSHIDTSSVQAINGNAIANATVKGQLTKEIRRRIKKSLPNNELLTQNQINLINANL